MTPTKVPYLCGGILFSLILQARKTRIKARDKFNSGSDGLKDTDVMMGLVKVVTGDSFESAQGGTFGKCTTQFKTCQDYGTTYIPFTDPSVISSYTSSIKQKDPDLLNRMSEFINRFINEMRSEWLVKSLIEVIQDDAEIDKNTLFDIALNKSVTKENLNSITDVELPVFLLSVLHFVITQRSDNTKGRATFEKWHTQSGKKSPWKFVSSVGTTNEISFVIKTTIEDANTSDTSPTDDVVEVIKSENQPKTPKARIEDKILVSGKATADAWGKVMETLADDMEKGKADQPEKPRLVINKLNENDTLFLKRFREGAKPLFKYCIDNDPSAEATDLFLSDNITDFINSWKFEYREIEDYAFRTLVKDTMDILSEYTYYISDQFLRLIPGRNILWFRNESWEEGEQLRKVLQPESYRLRCEIRDLYLRLYPLPEEDTKSENTTIIQQQTNVVQNGDNNINLTNNGTINIKL
jgi:hypothetical protein